MIGFKHTPVTKEPYVVIVYKNFAAHAGVSHIGLGVSALNTVKVLRAAGIRADVWALKLPGDLAGKVKDNPDVTHIVVNAAWVPISIFSALCSEFPEKQFFVNCHSNVGFLQADSNGVALIKQYFGLEVGSHNFHFAGNSRRFTLWVNQAMRANCSYLPNLYFLSDISKQVQPSRSLSGTLRLGIFGAIRPLKNFMTATAAALEIKTKFRMPLELWFNSGRIEGDGQVVLKSVKEMCAGLPDVTLQFADWATWAEFRKTVAHMNLLLQPSYTESFNMVTADGVSQGVASVVSEAIDWAPPSWKASVDDALDIARVGRHLLHDMCAVAEGLTALEDHNEDGTRAWQKVLM